MKSFLLLTRVRPVSFGKDLKNGDYSECNQKVRGLSIAKLSRAYTIENVQNSMLMVYARFFSERDLRVGNLVYL